MERWYNLAMNEGMNMIGVATQFVDSYDEAVASPIGVRACGSANSATGVFYICRFSC